jgi:putative iron-regulated protein
VLDAYVETARTGYAAALITAQATQARINAFVDAPSERLLAEARKSWLDSRAPYGRTEVFRYSGGPIDNEETGVEGLVNAWPLDEAYLDGVEGAPNAGIVMRPDLYPELTKDVIVALNEKDGEANIATGYHAQEFLLWGQDMRADGPGDRPFTDFVEPGGTRAEGRRRGQLLRVITDLLVGHLGAVVDAWGPLGDDGNTHGSRFRQGGNASLAAAFRGVVSLVSTELTRERMNNAYRTQDQEEEHSCFSDNTLADLLANLEGVKDVYLGRGSAPGLSEAVRAASPAVDDAVRARLADAEKAIGAIPAPFDQAILGSDEAPGRVRLRDAIARSTELGESLFDAAKALGFDIPRGVD